MTRAKFRTATTLLLAGVAGIALLRPPHAQADEGPAPRQTAVATFAGGCFWCLEPPFKGVDGVRSTTVGYTGGHTKNPTYQEVSAGGTGHAESVQIVYDPRTISYEKLLDIFWHNIDPTTPNEQFCDHGDQYRTAIFYHDETQRRLAEESKRRLEESRRFARPIVTDIVPAAAFYPAEEHHQKFQEKDPLHYESYRSSCGRDQRLHELWGAAASHKEDIR